MPQYNLETLKNDAVISQLKTLLGDRASLENINFFKEKLTPSLINHLIKEKNKSLVEKGLGFISNAYYKAHNTYAGISNDINMDLA